MKYKALLLAFIAVLAVMPSCRKNHYKVRITNAKPDIGIKRLEQDLFTLDPESVSSKVPELKQKYDGFLQLFSYVINTGDINDPAFPDFLFRFCTDKQNFEVYGMTMKLYPDVTEIEKDLENAFRHYLHYFPGSKVPAVFTCITGFNNSIITGDSVLGIGLDRYLGPDCKFYPQLEIYSYMAARMTPENIVPDCMYGWAMSEWDFESLDYEAENVLSEILHEGKLKYFEKCILPDYPDEIIFGFTDGQMNFCRNNEAQMWQYLVENDLLFKTDRFIIRKLTGEAPFTSYFTNQSPGRAAVWVGFRIVESYMSKNPAVTLKELMADTDIQKILEKARYNPQ
ncbi:MAG: hypothetical protein GYA41_07255 [Bacteroidales bacterium]|nr:hypothetical protein [Bacteroidales bacterium]